jgi:hypothetical protein
MTGGAVGSNDEVGTQLFAGAQPEPVDLSGFFQRLVSPTGYGSGPGIDGDLVEHGVEDRPGHCRAMAGVRQTYGTRQPHPTSGWTNDQHVTDGASVRHRYSEVGQQLEAAGTDQVTTRFVTRKGRFVDQRHPRSTPRQHEGSDTARRPTPDHEDVKAR